jgi:hypothetical protein
LKNHFKISHLLLGGIQLNQKERVEAFLKELDELSDKYDLHVTAEGNPPLLYDTKERNFAGEFGRSFFGGEYRLYEY